MKKKVLLIQVPYTQVMTIFPLGLAYIASFIQEHGYDGLFYPPMEDDNLCCGCKVDDLMPCGCPGGGPLECQPGFLSVNPEDENDWVICKEKAKK